MSNVIDKIKSWIPFGQSPVENKKANLTSVRHFNGAKIDRLTASFLATQTSINNELRTDLDKLRARSRHLGKNNDHGKKFKNLVVSNIVGPNGFTLYARSESAPGTPDKADNDAIEAAFKDWSRVGICDITGRMSFNDILSAICNGLPTDGEFLIRKIKGSAARNKYNFALQLIDVDRIDTNYNLASGTNTNAVRMGVEIDKYGRPVALHIFTAHPNDGANSSRSRERIPSNEIVHAYLVEHAEQYRGIPWMAPGILTLHHLGEFDQSALLAARKGADTLGFFVTPDGEPPMMDGVSQDQDPIEVSVPGTYDTLPEGVDFKPYESKYPDAMVDAFTKSFIRRIATGWNVSYTSLASDLEGVNFSSIRAGVLEERDAWMALQRWFIEHLLMHTYEEWLSMALLSGAIKLPTGSPLPASKLDKYMPHYWQGRRWQWVDPKKDIEAARLAIRTGVASPQMIAAQNGVDIEDVLADIARFEKQVAANGVTIVSFTDNPAQTLPEEPDPA
jgi:lambda family phage portal protein